ncbi:hypothetical protein LWI28_028921 [Acer negundo]|uniref:Rac-like GTP-binding protein ARAC7 n=1 Tax=Acer negundo TaxID=4023 RepID=A0AAD5JHD4_ACENE|nr:hypothetical protein LWI28_028921 [Acer negundo]
MSASKFIKCVTVGDGAVGKTCMLICYTSNKFPTDYIPTVFDNFSANVAVDGSIVNLGLWDTAVNFMDSHTSVIEILPLNFTQWMPELRRFAPNVPIVLVGTKLDLRDDSRYLVDQMGSNVVTSAQGEELRKQIGAAAYIECSSKTQQNVKAVFDTAIKVVLQPPRRKEMVARKKRRRSSGCSLAKQDYRNMNGRNGQMRNGSSSGVYRKGVFSNPGGANGMRNKDGEVPDARIRKNTIDKNVNHVKTTIAAMGKGSRFDILSEEVDGLLVKENNYSKGKDDVGKA